MPARSFTRQRRGHAGRDQRCALVSYRLVEVEADDPFMPGTQFSTTSVLIKTRISRK